MITLKEITFKNFLSFGNRETTVDLNTGEVALIMGENKDVGASGYSKNGAGKTTMFQAISWCLFGEGINNIKQDNFINIKNGKKMIVKISMEVDGDDFLITRGRKPNKFEILKNGEPFTLHSASNNDDAIVELLGMDSQIFFNTTMLSSNIEPFMNLKPSQQKLFMENLLSINLLAEYVKKLKKEKKDVETEILLEEKNKEYFFENKRKLEERLNRLVEKQNDWQTSTKEKLVKLNNNLQKLESLDLEEMQSILSGVDEIKIKIGSIEKEIQEVKDAFKSELNEIALEEKNVRLKYNSKESDAKRKVIQDKQIEIDKVKDIKEKKITSTEALKDEYLSLESELKDAEKDLKKVKADHKKLKKEQDSLDHGVCPYCEQSFTSEDKTNHISKELKELESLEEDVLDFIEENKEKHDAIKAEYKSTKKEIEDEYKKELSEIDDMFQSSFDSIEEEFEQQQDEELNLLNKREDKIKLKMDKEIKSKVDDIEKLNDEIKGLYEEIDDICDDNIRHPSDIKLKREEIVNLKSQIKDLKKEEDPYIDDIQHTEKELKEEYDDTILKDLKNKVDHFDILVKLLSDSKSFLRRNLINESIEFVNTTVNNYLIELESPHIVRINDDLSIDIDYIGKMVSYGNLSNGERLRLNVAISLAFRRLIEASGNSINLLAIDELLDNGLDGAGFHNVFKLIKSFENKTTFIISHREELIPEVDKLMIIEKENGFSHIS